MPSQSTPTPESALIEAFVRERAPKIHEVSCGKRLDGGYELWLRLNPAPAAAKQVIITKQTYKNGQWERVVIKALEEANLERA